MRSLRSIAAVSAVALIALSACSSTEPAESASGESETGGVTTIRVGASPSPHAKILQYIDDNLAADAGIDLDIVEYSDYIQPNVALNDGDLDANYFQTVPYLEDQTAESGYAFTPGKGIHLEPLAVYSSSVKDLKDFPEGGKIGIIADVTNQARALKLLADNGFVELPTDEGNVNVNTVKKLKNFEFLEVEGAQLVRSLEDVDIAVINGNFAQEGGLSQAQDALVVEAAENNPAANILVWKSDLSGDTAEGVKTLEKLLHSDEVREYITTTWADGSVIPTF